MTPALLNALCCPESHQPLALANADLIAALNARIASAQLRNLTGQPVLEKLDGGLQRQDGRRLYPIRGQLPILLIGEAIPLPP